MPKEGASMDDYCQTMTVTKRVISHEADTVILHLHTRVLLTLKHLLSTDAKVEVVL